MSTTFDPEPLPRGYTCDASRSVFFSLNDHTPGVKGLAFAVLLRAIEDGCNKEWLRQIAHAYGIEVPEGMLDKTPIRRLAIDTQTECYFDVEKNPLKKRRARKFKTLWIEGLTIPFGCITTKPTII